MPPHSGEGTEKCPPWLIASRLTRMEHWNQEEKPCKERGDGPDRGQWGTEEDGQPSKGGGHFEKVGVVTLGL